MDSIKDRYELLKEKHPNDLIMVYEEPFYYLHGPAVQKFTTLAGLPDSNQADPSAAFPQMLLDKLLQLFEDDGYTIQKEPDYILCFEED